MPRLSPCLLRYAASRNKHLPRLLRECRDLESASSELRWLAEHANQKIRHMNRHDASKELSQFVRRRSKGEPLQYILGNQPFGTLDILCRRKVLIPRPETELYTTALANLIGELRQQEVISITQQIKIADLCTGTGCISLLLYALLQSTTSGVPMCQALQILGADISPDALRLARENLEHNINIGLLKPSCREDIAFEFLDVLELGRTAGALTAPETDAAEGSDPPTTSFLNNDWDVIVSNPPYISPADYGPGGTVCRSVRNYEPKLALVPPPQNSHAMIRSLPQADRFYEAVLQTACEVRAKLLLLEVGDSKQASRVRKLIPDIMSCEVLVETWRDDGMVELSTPATESYGSTCTANVAHERVVAVWTGSWKEWRMKTAHGERP